MERFLEVAKKGPITLNSSLKTKKLEVGGGGGKFTGDYGISLTVSVGWVVNGDGEYFFGMKVESRSGCRPVGW